jgi:hypothetical protein
MASSLEAALREVLRDLVREVVRVELPALLRDATHADDMLTLTEAGQLAGGVKPRTVRRWVKRGLKASRQAGVRGTRIRRGDLMEWLAGPPVSIAVQRTLASLFGDSAERPRRKR